MNDIKILEKLMKENIKGGITKKALKEWFLNVQNKSSRGFCMYLDSNRLYKIAENLGIRVVNKERELKGIHSIEKAEGIKVELTKTNFKFTREQFEQLYLIERLSQKQIAKELRVSNNTVKNAAVYWGLGKRKYKKASNEIKITENLLKELYINQHLSQRKVANALETTQVNVGKKLKEYGIKSRNRGGIQYE
jgi:hypothetical protein